MQVLDKLKNYLHEYSNGEYDDRLYIDMSITADKNLSFDAVGLIPTLIEYYWNKTFVAEDIVHAAQQSRTSVLKGLDNLKENGYIGE